MNILDALPLNGSFRRAKRWLSACCLFIVIGLLLVLCALCGMSVYLVRQVGAQGLEPGASFEGPARAPLQVLLLIDNSNSMYEKDGIGSDPGLLRIEAARLFINYLGVDSSGPAHRLGVIFFGHQAHLQVPLTPLASDTRRSDMLQLLADPPRMGWTDPEAALALAAETLLARDRPCAGCALVLLTDGKPERSTAPTAREQATTIARLRERAGLFAAADVSLFIILLQNTATDADPEIEGTFVPLWQEIAQATPHGRFYRARQGEELLDIYHDIVVTLTGRETSGIVVQTRVETETSEQVTVEPGLAQVTFVIRKSAPSLRVTVQPPRGLPLAPGDPGVRYGGRPGQGLEEIWAVDDPPPGDWQVHIDGQGAITVWKDFYPAIATPHPTRSPTASPTPSRSPTRTPTFSPSPTASATPRPTRTPTRTPAAATRTPSPSPPAAGRSGGPPGWWIGLPLIALGVGGGWLWFRWRRAVPLLEGTLRRLTAPSGQTIMPARLDLGTLGRREISLGPGPNARLRLAHVAGEPTPAARLVARRGPDGQPGVVLVIQAVGDQAGQAQVNGLPIAGEWLLRDGDVIALGAWRLRYENLRRRAPAHRPTEVMREGEV